jgi:quinol monooxygenase YgiN
MSVAIVGQFRLPPENLERARPEMRKVLESSRVEAGCHEYNFGEDVLDSGLIRVSEVWDSVEHLMAHTQTPHYLAWAEMREELSLSGRRITLFHVSSEQEV